MKIFKKINIKDTNIENKLEDVTIGINNETDEVRKYKFKRPLMLKIFIPFSIITFSTIIFYIFSLTDNNFETSFDTNIINLESNPSNMLIEFENYQREKRQLKVCESCDEETVNELLETVQRCKKNLENQKDCCELYEHVKKLSKQMINVQKGIDLLSIPCKHKNTKHDIEDKEKDKTSSSSSSSSNESKDDKENKSKHKEDASIEESQETSTYEYSSDNYSNLTDEIVDNTSTFNYNKVISIEIEESDNPDVDKETQVIDESFIEKSSTDNYNHEDENYEKEYLTSSTVTNIINTTNASDFTHIFDPKPLPLYPEFDNNEKDNYESNHDNFEYDSNNNPTPNYIPNVSVISVHEEQQSEEKTMKLNNEESDEYENKNIPEQTSISPSDDDKTNNYYTKSKETEEEIDIIIEHNDSSINIENITTPLTIENNKDITKEKYNDIENHNEHVNYSESNDENIVIYENSINLTTELTKISSTISVTTEPTVYDSNEMNNSNDYETTNLPDNYNINIIAEINDSEESHSQITTQSNYDRESQPSIEEFTENDNNQIKDEKYATDMKINEPFDEFFTKQDEISTINTVTTNPSNKLDQIDEENIYVKEETERQDDQTFLQNVSTFPNIHEGNKKQVSIENENDEEGNFNININITTQQIKNVATKPSSIHYEKELMKSNYHKNGHELKLEQINNNHNKFAIEQHHVVNNDYNSVDNDDSDYYFYYTGKLENVPDNQKTTNENLKDFNTTPKETEDKNLEDEINSNNSEKTFNIYAELQQAEIISTENVINTENYNNDEETTRYFEHFLQTEPITSSHDTMESEENRYEFLIQNENQTQDYIVGRKNEEPTTSTIVTTRFDDDESSKNQNLSMMEENDNTFHTEKNIKEEATTNTFRTEESIQESNEIDSSEIKHSKTTTEENNFQLNLEQTTSSTLMPEFKISEEVGVNMDYNLYQVDENQINNAENFLSKSHISTNIMYNTEKSQIDEEPKHVKNLEGPFNFENSVKTSTDNEFNIATTKLVISPNTPPSSLTKIQARTQENTVNDMRIVNQNAIAQRFQNIGPNFSKFDTSFQLPPIESSKASQQLTVNTNMMPMCFYGLPNQNVPAFRQPGYELPMNPFSMAHTTYAAFGYPQMFQNNAAQQPMYNMYNNMLTQQKHSGNFMNQPPYMTNPYFCTYIPSSSMQFPPVSSVPEFRNSDNRIFTLPEDLDDKTIPDNIFESYYNNKSRSSLNCLRGERSCFDGSKCIKDIHWCDGVVHCKDQSDEFGCPCKTRVDKSRLCDGYFDCPNGEDELGCFGCSKFEFSCDDWSERRKTATCVSMNERCDGIAQCKTGKDEMDCSLLTNTINSHQTYAVSKSSGYLHRNFKGKWYPVCSNTDTWVLDACLAEVGPQTTFPLVHTLPVFSTYTGQFLTALPHKKVEFLKSCIGGEAIYVTCPPIPCGTRLIPPPNHFRKHEVDTSAEEDFLPFVNRLKRFTDEIHNPRNLNNIFSTNDFDDKRKHAILDVEVNQHIDPHKYNEWSWVEQERGKRGDNRVVGGKPSQPTSWPWVVAIYRDGIFHCGGVLMSELWVITAAHCVDTYWQHYYEVQAGMLRRFSFSPMEQNRIVSNIVGHHMYDRTDMKNDLALLKMFKPFQFNRWVRPVCLPSESSAGPNWMWGPQPGTICTAVGWGATIEHGPDPDHMREVDVPILSQCKHREDQEGQEICAGYLEGGRDACQGDSGGPLLCRNPLAPSQWYVAGIVSHGEGCARPNEPGAYTRVSLYLNWIARSILDENLPKRKPIQKCPGTLCLGTRRCISKKRRCDKTVDCLIGDDEIDCPKSNFPSLIKHAFENMFLFASNNMTTNQPSEDKKITDKREHEGTDLNTPKNMITLGMEEENITITTVHTTTLTKNTKNEFETNEEVTNIKTVNKPATEHAIITSTIVKDFSGQTATMNRNDGISPTLSEISDTTRLITNTTASTAPTGGEIPNTSITLSTFITTDDTISESTASTTPAHVTAVNDVTVTTSIRSRTETPASGVINDSRGALNSNDKNMVDAGHKTETALPEEIKSITEMSITHNTGADDFSEKKNNSTINTFNNTLKQMPVYFECRKMLQLIPISRRCDKILDCEDGTDEARCTCKEYLLASYPNAICDGVIDCNDGTDEKNCITCLNSQFHCHLSLQCIPKQFQCNHISDCFFNEDEWDCFALTNDSYIKYENDNRPELRGKGIMSFSFSGKWFPLCNKNWFDSASDVAGDMCAYLGFSGYQKYFETEVKQESLQIISTNTTSLTSHSKTNETCRALYVKCSNSLSDTGDMKKMYTAHQSGANTFKEVLTSPWNAAIFVDGTYVCSGTLIEKDWVITSRTCLHHIHLHINYTTVMLGAGRGHHSVVGPHEQIRIISEIVPIIVTDIILLRLQIPVNFTRYVRPLYITNINNDFISDKETCVITGKDNGSILQSLVLIPILSKCSKGKRCFKRVTPTIDCDKSSVKLPWGGTIVCLSENGWYPAAVYYDQRGFCGFRQTAEYTSIRNYKSRVILTMSKHDYSAPPPSCTGLRCPLGQCITPHQICDGILDCRDGSDEDQEVCDEKLRQCTATSTCECSSNELKCHNGKCIPKSAFCDRVNDCGDWSDEPARCNCSAYLALVAPHRLCDGISNCNDKTDESPRMCGCHKNSFKCGKSGVCIPNDYVCDGDYDCPDKEDEKLCLALKAPMDERDGAGEVMLRSYGIWHSYCMPEKSLTTPELEEICSDLQYPSNHAAIVNKTFIHPAQDVVIENFSLVRFNAFVVMFLKGDYPMAKLQDNENCKRLYIECTMP